MLVSPINVYAMQTGKTSINKNPLSNKNVSFGESEGGISYNPIEDARKHISMMYDYKGYLADLETSKSEWNPIYKGACQTFIENHAKKIEAIVRSNPSLKEEIEKLEQEAKEKFAINPRKYFENLIPELKCLMSDMVARQAWGSEIYKHPTLLRKARARR